MKFLAKCVCVCEWGGGGGARKKFQVIHKNAVFFRDPEKTDMKNLLKLDCDWMAGFFLDFIGLPEYNRYFLRNRIDGLTMSMMNGDEIEAIIKNDSKSSKSNKQCAVSISFGWQLMRFMKYNTQVI